TGESTTDIVFASFREGAEVSPTGNTLAGGSNRQVDLSDGWDQGNPNRGVGDDRPLPGGQGEEQDYFWPWMDRRIPSQSGKVRPAGHDGDGQASPDGRGGRRPILPPGAEAGDVVFAQRAGQEAPSSGVAVPSGAGAEADRVPAVDSRRATARAP